MGGHVRVTVWPGTCAGQLDLCERGVGHDMRPDLPYNPPMNVTIPLDPQAECRLRERAEAAGDDLAGFVTKLVGHFGALPTPLEQLAGPAAERFRASGSAPAATRRKR